MDTDTHEEYDDYEIEEKIDRNWMISDMEDYEKNYKLYEQFKTKNNDKYILTHEDTNKIYGYNIKEHGEDICATFWVFENDNTNNKKYHEKQIIYNSLESLYNDSKRGIDQDLVTHALLQQSKHKMICDFINYYDDYKKQTNKSLT
jgi:hypothetical protein